MFSGRVKPKVVALAFLAMCAASMPAREALGSRFGKTQAVAENIRIEAEPRRPGPLYVSVGGSERKIADDALAAWLVDGGRSVVYSGRDGAGGYENEGQSLRIYNIQTAGVMKILSEYFAIDNVREVRTRAGKLALLVEMKDGGLGASHLAVVDPSRGEVFSKSRVKLLEWNSDVLQIGYFRERDWEQLSRGVAVRPYKTERLNLNDVIKRKIVTNKPKI